MIYLINNICYINLKFKFIILNQVINLININFIQNNKYYNSLKYKFNNLCFILLIIIFSKLLSKIFFIIFYFKILLSDLLIKSLKYKKLKKLFKY